MNVTLTDEQCTDLLAALYCWCRTHPEDAARGKGLASHLRITRDRAERGLLTPDSRDERRLDLAHAWGQQRRQRDERFGDLLRTLEMQVLDAAIERVRGASTHSSATAHARRMLFDMLDDIERDAVAFARREDSDAQGA